MDGMTTATQACDPMALQPIAPPSYNHEVRIIKAENGFMIHVGCKLFVSQSWAEVASGLELYYTDPKKAEQKFLAKK